MNCRHPKVLRFGRKQDHLNDLCLLVSHNEKLRKTKRKALFGTSEITNYTMLPEHSRWFIRYYTKEILYVLIIPAVEEPI